MGKQGPIGQTPHHLFVVGIHLRQALGLIPTYYNIQPHPFLKLGAESWRVPEQGLDTCHRKFIQRRIPGSPHAGVVSSGHESELKRRLTEEISISWSIACLFCCCLHWLRTVPHARKQPYSELLLSQSKLPKIIEILLPFSNPFIKNSVCPAIRVPKKCIRCYFFGTLCSRRFNCLPA